MTKSRGIRDRGPQRMAPIDPADRIPVDAADDILTKPHKGHEDAVQRFKVSQRRAQVAALYHAGWKMDDIALRFNVDRAVISIDIQILKEHWRDQGALMIGEWVERELAYALEQRAESLLQWQQGHKPAYMNLVIRWTERIAALLGMDAPAKTDDWSDKDWQSYAASNGLSADEVVKEAEQIVRSSQRGDVIAEPSDDAGG